MNGFSNTAFRRKHNNAPERLNQTTSIAGGRDFKRGSNLKIYERDKDYYVTGHHYANEEKGNDSWFAVTAYTKKDVDNDKVIEDHSSDEKAILAVRLSDVDHIEIFN